MWKPVITWTKGSWDFPYTTLQRIADSTQSRESMTHFIYCHTTAAWYIEATVPFRHNQLCRNKSSLTLGEDMSNFSDTPEVDHQQMQPPKHRRKRNDLMMSDQKLSTLSCVIWHIKRKRCQGNGWAAEAERREENKTATCVCEGINWSWEGEAPPKHLQGSTDTTVKIEPKPHPPDYPPPKRSSDTPEEASNSAGKKVKVEVPKPPAAPERTTKQTLSNKIPAPPIRRIWSNRSKNSSSLMRV